MSDQDKAVDRAVRAFAALHRVDAGSVAVTAVRKERIPNPPVPPGQMSVDPVFYRFLIHLKAGGVEGDARVEHGEVHLT